MNLKLRFKNPIFLVQLFLSIITPILAYYGLTGEDITTWGKLLHIFTDAISNPYVVFTMVVSLWNTITDPTTKGLKDSDRVKNATKPLE